MSRVLSSSQAVKYDDDVVDEMDGLEQISNEDTEDADEEVEEELKDGIEKEVWNIGVGGTIISTALLIGSVTEGNRSWFGVLGDSEKGRGVVDVKDASAD
ncbi:hypothetical protein FBU30_010949 [Linnemannia zychae]|nr:hypothetical protein FBU30_010949 [Linnemannia zychae]